MQIEKEHKEFHTISLDRGWETPDGYPSGIQQQILAGNLDETKKLGYRTRHLLIRSWGSYHRPIRPRLLGGGLSSLRRPLLSVAMRMAMAVRNLAQIHMLAGPQALAQVGPFKSDTGCLLLEVHLYGSSDAGASR